MTEIESIVKDTVHEGEQRLNKTGGMTVVAGLAISPTGSLSQDVIHSHK